MIGLVDGNNFFVSCERVFNRRLVGRPVAVLSNNDGCCVARSNEFKALGIAMGTPYYQLKHREKSGELCFCSSNYELYGDMSKRIISILREEALDVEQYSIDEAFIYPPMGDGIDLIEYGKRIRAKILRWVGIPCGVGFAPTKTLAKIANHIGKKRPDGVFLMPDDPTEILAALPVQEVWGVGRRLCGRRWSCAAFHATRSGTTTQTPIRSPVPARSANRPPRQRRLQSPSPPTPRRLPPNFADTGFSRRGATSTRRSSPRAEEAIFWGDALYIEGTRYRKTGIVFFGLEKPGTAHQTDLFDDTPPAEKSRLYAAVDALNARYSKGKVFSAAQGLGARSWHMKRQKLSRRPTTRWDELMTVR